MYQYMDAFSVKPASCVTAVITIPYIKPLTYSVKVYYILLLVPENKTEEKSAESDKEDVDNKESKKERKKRKRVKRKKHKEEKEKVSK